MTTIDEYKLEAMEYVRRQGGPTPEQLEFAQFQVGFPPDMGLEQIYISYLKAKLGDEQTSMANEYPKEFSQ